MHSVAKYWRLGIRIASRICRCAQRRPPQMPEQPSRRNGVNRLVWAARDIGYPAYRFYASIVARNTPHYELLFSAPHEIEPEAKARRHQQG